MSDNTYILPMLIMPALSLIVNNCSLKEECERKTLEAKVEKVAVQGGVQAYTVNAAGKTNYFKYNGSFYAPMSTNEVIKTTN